MCATDKFFNNLESWYKYRYLCRKHILVKGVALITSKVFTNDINTNKSDMHSPKGVYQNSNIIYSIVFVLSSNSSYMTK